MTIPPADRTVPKPIDRLATAVLAVNEAWQFTYLNAGAEQLMDRRQNGLLGRDSRDELPALRNTPLATNLHTAMAGRMPVSLEWFCQARRVWLRIRAYPRAGGLIIYAADITRQKRLERSVRQHRRQLEAMASELALAEERERRRIAEHLHDRVGQTLLLAKMKIRRLRAQPGVPEDGMRELEALVDQLVRETRTLTSELSPPILYEAGLPAALRWLADKAGREYGFGIDVQTDERPVSLDDSTAVCLFQVVRELLMNIAKHAEAHQVHLSLRQSGQRVLIEVSDDGVGFDPDRKSAASGGMGLFVTRQRLEHLGGTFRIDSAAGRGTHAVLTARLSSRRSES